MTDFLPAGVSIRWFDVLDSTNNEVRRQAEEAHPSGLWVVARRQTHGRGRRNRTWVSPEGNLMCSLLMRPACDLAHAAQLSFVAGLAVHDTVLSFCSDTSLSVRLKWPNDLLLNRKKVAGILLESAATGCGAASWVAVGIGINLACFPEDMPYPATSLAHETGRTLSAREVLPVLAGYFDDWQRIWEGPEGFRALRESWLERAEGVGNPVVVRLAETELEGIFEGLDEEGSLILRQDTGGCCLVPAGDLFFPDRSA